LSGETGYSLTVVPRPQITEIVQEAGRVRLTFTSVVGRSYRLQYKAHLDDERWTDLDSQVTADGSTATLEDAIGPATQRFYRMAALP
jgi:hypothetical protein